MIPNHHNNAVLKVSMESSTYSTLIEVASKKLRNLEPGEKYIYYTGFLDGERLYRPLSAYCRIADIAYKLMEAGNITLVQRRVSAPLNTVGNPDWVSGIGSGFQYIAVGLIPKIRTPNIKFEHILRERWA